MRGWVRSCLLKEVAYLATLLLMTMAVQGQSPPRERENFTTIRATSNLVMVPALVRSASGEVVGDLKAEDFKLTDNGVEQKNSVEKVDSQPIAVAVLMQTGGAAPRQFQNYPTLNAMVTLLLGSSTHRVGIVTFDSHPEEIWNFPPMADGLQYAFSHPENGDHGAAILDAVNLGIQMLQQQPASFRRIILLLSQARDCGSKTSAADVVRHLGQSNTTVYSITFVPKKGLPQVESSGACEQTSAGLNASDRVSAIGTLQQPESLDAILKAMGDDTAAEAALLSGGEQMRLDSKNDLEHKLSILADHFSNSYTLSFRPGSKEAGLHSIRVEVNGRRGPLNVAARRIYWFAESAKEN
jgi:VWFA-related protein